jgi:hypothetical protein
VDSPDRAVGELLRAAAARFAGFVAGMSFLAWLPDTFLAWLPDRIER